MHEQLKGLYHAQSAGLPWVITFEAHSQHTRDHHCEPKAWRSVHALYTKGTRTVLALQGESESAAGQSKLFLQHILSETIPSLEYLTQILEAHQDDNHP